jgi:uncharacterized protein YggE
LLGVHIEMASGSRRHQRNLSLGIKVEAGNRRIDLASQKNATLERIEWKYPEESVRERALETAIGKGKAKAQKVASAMGVKLLGVYDFIENMYDEEMPVPFQHQALMAKPRAVASVAEQSLGMDIQHSKIVQVNVEIWYRVSSF